MDTSVSATSGVGHVESKPVTPPQPAPHLHQVQPQAKLGLGGVKVGLLRVKVGLVTGRPSLQPTQQQPLLLPWPDPTCYSLGQQLQAWPRPDPTCYSRGLQLQA